MARARKKVIKSEPRMYVGPTLKGGLSNRTVFRGEGYPAHVAAIIERQPAVRGLIVPVSQSAEALKAVEVKGHLLNTYAREVVR